MKFKSAIIIFAISSTTLCLGYSSNTLDDTILEETKINASKTTPIKKIKKIQTTIHKKPLCNNELTNVNSDLDKSESKPNNSEKNICPNTTPQIKANIIAATAFSDTMSGVAALSNVIIKSGTASLDINGNTFATTNNEGNSLSRQYFDVKQTIISDIGSISAIGNYTQYNAYIFTESPANLGTFNRNKDAIKATSIGFLASQNFMNSFSLELAPLFHSRNGSMQDSFWGAYISPEYTYKIDSNKNIVIKIIYDSNNLTLGSISNNNFDCSRPTNYTGILQGRVTTQYDLWNASLTISQAKNKDTSQNDNLYGGMVSYKIPGNVDFFAQYESRQQNSLYMIGVKTIIF